MHTHTDFSIPDGACDINRLTEAAAIYGMPAVAITDNGVMYGAAEFCFAAKRRGIKPIVGCEVSEADGGRVERKSGEPDGSHLVLLAMNSAGYSNLSRLVSSVHMRDAGAGAGVNRELLARHSGGLIALSGCLNGRLAGMLLNGAADRALAAAGEYADIFGKGCFYLELQDHGLPEQRTVNRGLVELSRRTGLKIVATNNAHYIKKDDAETREILAHIRAGGGGNSPDITGHAAPELYFKSTEEMLRMFSDAPDAIENTIEIADKCDVEFIYKEPCFSAVMLPGNETLRSYATRLCYNGAIQRYGIKNPWSPTDSREKHIVDRINHELDVMEKAGYTAYLLAVWDYTRFAKEQNIPMSPGRGACVSSVAAYCLGITGVDPLRRQLIFERFMSLERIWQPNFYLDFCPIRRREIVEYLKGKYGRDNTVHPVVIRRFNLEGAVREVCRACGTPEAESARLAKAWSRRGANCCESVADCSDPNEKRIIAHARAIEGLCVDILVKRDTVIIGDESLSERIPLIRRRGTVASQYSAECAEMLGIRAFDLPGLKVLAVMDSALKLAEKNRGIAVDIESIPEDDPDTFATVRAGDTAGVPHLDNATAGRIISRIGASNLDDLAAAIFLSRLGRIFNRNPDKEYYAARQAGARRIVYDDERLEPVLKETFGVILYQEQVIRIACILAGYSLGKGDIFRRVLNMKRLDEVEKQRVMFIAGCMERGLSRQKAEAIFRKICEVAPACYLKAHTSALALLAYRAAWLKTHYPDEFSKAHHFTSGFIVRKLNNLRGNHYESHIADHV